MVTSSTPIFAASDIQETIRFYEETLGFGASWTWGEPPTFGSVSWGKVQIMFNLQPELAVGIRGHQHWIGVDNIDELYGRHLERGAMIVSPIEDKPWGSREYTVQDLNGYHLRFAGDPTHESKGSGEYPAGVSIVERLATPEEFEKVAGSAFYSSGTLPGSLARTYKMFVAVSPDGEVIGTTRIMLDAPGWYSIWDVAVLPEWRGQRIGTALVQAAIDLVRAESPGAWLYLFTYKHDFYARLGFGKESLTMMRV